ncbi:hypothetical protein N431DRAFT_430025 [Stipitochalara longipes BDJ]|nr:hypothetical protein N431DRAFT_430025 [Stipitochalara longipes BDJ]
MEQGESPPPYTTSAISPLPSAGGGHDASASREREPGEQYLVHLPGTSRSTYTRLRSARQTQTDPIRGSDQRSPLGQANSPPEYPANSTPAVHYASIAGSSPSINTTQNVVIVRQPVQPAPCLVQQSGVSNSFSPRENAVIIRPAGQPALGLVQQGSLASFITDDSTPPFADEPLPSFAQAIAESNRRFPKDFGFYSVLNSFSDMAIAPRDNANHLYYISTHHRLSNKRSIILHSGRLVYSPPLATADFPRFTNTIDIELMATPLNGLERHHLEKSGTFGAGRVFSITLPGSDVPEHFEWKQSQGEEVTILHGTSHGEKLVRVNTGEVVAAWTAPLMSGTKKGQMSFLGNRELLGEKFEVMAVICMLGIMGKDHGSNKADHQNASVARSGGVARASS